MNIDGPFEIFLCKKDCDADYQPCLNHCGGPLVEDCYLQCGNELGACKLSKSYKNCTTKRQKTEFKNVRVTLSVQMAAKTVIILHVSVA